MTAPSLPQLDVEDEDRTALRVLADWLQHPEPTETADRLIRDLNAAGTTTAAIGQVLAELVSREDACPECPTGVVESVGRMESDTGHQPYACNAGCGYRG